MWYEVRQEFSYENWSEGVFKTIDEAVDCILEQFNGNTEYGHLLTYDLVDGLPKVIGIAEVKGTAIKYLDNDVLEDVMDSDTAYTLDDDKVILIHHGGKLDTDKIVS